MTVRELIKKLQKCSPDAIVCAEVWSDPEVKKIGEYVLDGVTYVYIGDDLENLESELAGGDELPTEIIVLTSRIDNEWDGMDDDERAEAISDYLSDSCGFCHYGFDYEESNGRIYIKNIEWDTEE